MAEYRFTFGMKYAHEPHPNCEWVHPDGYLAVIAPNAEIAQALACAVVGRVEPDGPYAYAFGYSVEEYSDGAREDAKRPPWDETYPLGALARVRLEIL